MTNAPDPQSTRNPQRDSLDTLPTGDLTPDDGGTEEMAGTDADALRGGEGNVEADRRYREGVLKTVQSGQVEELAEEARRALDGAEGEELERARESARLGHAVKPAKGRS